MLLVTGMRQFAIYSDVGLSDWLVPCFYNWLTFCTHDRLGQKCAFETFCKSQKFKNRKENNFHLDLKINQIRISIRFISHTLNYVFWLAMYQALKNYEKIAMRFRFRKRTRHTVAGRFPKCLWHCWKTVICPNVLVKDLCFLECQGYLLD